MYKYEKGTLPKEEIAWFEKMNPKHKCTGETLSEVVTETNGLERGTTYVVMKGNFTAYGMCRDCGDHYIIARWSRYDKVDKETLEITFDVEDR